jgi:hypothetical protein
MTGVNDEIRMTNDERRTNDEARMTILQNANRCESSLILLLRKAFAKSKASLQAHPRPALLDKTVEQALCEK